MSCSQSAVWWACPRWASSAPLRWWSRWGLSPSAAWWHRRGRREVLLHTPARRFGEGTGKEGFGLFAKVRSPICAQLNVMFNHVRIRCRSCFLFSRLLSGQICWARHLVPITIIHLSSIKWYQLIMNTGPKCSWSMRERFDGQRRRRMASKTNSWSSFIRKNSALETGHLSLFLFSFQLQWSD